MKKKLNISIVLVLCILLTGCGSKENKIYSILEENNYKIFYSFSHHGNYYDLDKNIYNSSYKESDFIREVLDETTVASIYIVNMDTIDSVYKEEYFAYIPDATVETKYIYNAYIDNTSYMHRWNADSSESYIDSNGCRYYIKESNNSEKCTEENVELAKNFYNNNYLSTLNKLNITEEELVSLFDDITSNYIESHRKELIKNDKGITYKEFLTNIENSGLYEITKTSTTVSITEEKLLSYPTMYNMYISFEDNKVDILFLEYLEHVFLIYDNKHDKYSVMTKDTNCLYDIENSIYSSECSESDKETLKGYIKQSDIQYTYSDFSLIFRTTMDEFINHIEQYYINN